MSTQKLQRFALFSGLSDKALQLLANSMRRLEIPAQRTIVQEGAIIDTIFCIDSGVVEVHKLASEKGLSPVLATLKTGDSIGELSLLGTATRSASIYTIQPSILLTINTADLQEILGTTSPEDYAQLLKNAGKITADRLLKTNTITVAALEKQVKEAVFRNRMANFFTQLVAILCIYAYFLAFVNLYVSHSLHMVRSVYLPLVVITFLLVPTVIFIFKNYKTNHLPISFYGLTTTGWREAVKEAFIFSLPALLLIVLTKWLAIYSGFTTTSVNLFNGVLINPNPRYSSSVVLGLMCIYLVFAPVQEFIARGVIQGSLAEFISGKHSRWQGIILSNLIFSAMHLSLSIGYALAAFFPGLLWGWLYSRQRNLIGVSVSHALIGGWAIYVVGVRAWVIN